MNIAEYHSRNHVSSIQYEYFCVVHTVLIWLIAILILLEMLMSYLTQRFTFDLFSARIKTPLLHNEVHIVL